MSLKAEFHRRLEEIVRLPSPTAEAILDALIEIANDELDRLTAERLALDAWEQANTKRKEQ